MSKLVSLIRQSQLSNLLSALVFMSVVTPLFGQMPLPQAPPMGGAAAPPPQAVGPKTPGMIRIGVVPSQAQVGQGNNAAADYGTPIRNSIVLLMSGPAVDIVGLDARLPIQAQAEAQQKQCDYLLFTAVDVKHANSGGFGKFMKFGSAAANATPVGMMSKMGSMAAAQVAASQVAMMSAQQQAVNQLAQFNGQVKSKDDVTLSYQLLPTGQSKAKLENTLKGKAKSDGEDVLTPLIQQAATTILTEAVKK